MSHPSGVNERPYLFYELTNSICSQCLCKVEAKVLIQDEQVYLQKICPVHGRERVLISTDADYYKQCRHFIKRGQIPKRFNTQTRLGCPYDCGLCEDHEQHSCLTLVEITDRCNLTCPICYAESSPQKHADKSLEDIDALLEAIVANEGEPDIVQISGGEPTIHPQFFEILDLAKTKPIRHLMVNTNGVRIAQDEAFAERLATYMPGFELYLQFDSLDKLPIETLRGQDLLSVRMKALERLNALKISTTLVVTLRKGLNDHEMGRIIDFALQQPCVRGVTFQPIQSAGRLQAFNPETDRLTLGEVRQQLLKQSSVFQPNDVLPVPCHPDCIAMAYALKSKQSDGSTRAIPLSGLINSDILLKDGRNTIVYEQDPALKTELFRLLSLGHSPESSSVALKDLLCCLPQLAVPGEMGYDKLFRVIIMEFLDPYNFDVRSVKRSCVHIVHHDGRIIPFDTYNIFYRDDKLDVEKLAGVKE